MMAMMDGRQNQGHRKRCARDYPKRGARKETAWWPKDGWRTKVWESVGAPVGTPIPQSESCSRQAAGGHRMTSLRAQREGNRKSAARVVRPQCS